MTTGINEWVRDADDAQDEAPEVSRRASDRRRRWIRFTLAEQAYAVEVLAVREVIPLGSISDVPGAPPHVIGVINLRGQIVTVVDLRQHVGLAPIETSPQTRIIVLDGGELTIGIQVDSVSEVIEVAESDIGPSPRVGEVQPIPVSGVVVSDDEMLTLIEARQLTAQWIGCADQPGGAAA